MKSQNPVEDKQTNRTSNLRHNAGHIIAASKNILICDK